MLVGFLISENIPSGRCNHHQQHVTQQSVVGEKSQILVEKTGFIVDSKFRGYFSNPLQKEKNLGKLGKLQILSDIDNC